ncbi:MAG TPA: heavy metal-binding domain-containing protein [Flavisolibacter sp.]|nr:heavy metal-binding domain-containing protein [Flavisolibacter sp.]
MKRVILAVLVVTSLAFTACNSSDTKSKESVNTGTEKNGQLASDEMYTCTMHNEVMSAKTGTCPKCGMNLVKQKMTPEQEKMMKEGTYVKSKEEQ